MNEGNEPSLLESSQSLQDSKSFERSRIISQLYSIEGESKSLELHIKEHGLKDLSLVLPLYSQSGDSTVEYTSNQSDESDLITSASEYSSNQTMKESESSGKSHHSQKTSKLQKFWKKMTHQEPVPVITEENNFSVYKNKLSQFHVRTGIFK